MLYAVARFTQVANLLSGLDGSFPAFGGHCVHDREHLSGKVHVDYYTGSLLGLCESCMGCLESDHSKINISTSLGLEL